LVQLLVIVVGAFVGVAMFLLHGVVCTSNEMFLV